MDQPTFTLTDTHRQFRAAVRQMAEDRIAPHAMSVDRDEAFPWESYKALTEMELPALAFAPEYGGAGADMVTQAIAAEELARVCASTSVTFLVTKLGMLPVMNFASEELKREYLPKVASGQSQASYCLSEADAGSDVASMRCRAVRDGDSYILNGTKYWITNAGVSDTYTVFAKTDPDAGHRGISCFLVEKDWGVKVAKLEHKLGLRGSPTGEVVFEDVRVPASHRIGEEGEGFKVAMSCLDSGRYCVASGAAGTIRACLDMSVSYARQRRVQGEEIGRFQLVQQMIAGMARDYDIARLLWMRAGWLKNQGQRSSRESALAKWVNSERANRCADDALQVHGATGFSEECPAARYLRNSRATLIYEGTREVQTQLAAEYALGYREDRPVRCPLPAWPNEEEAGSEHSRAPS